MQEDTLQFLRDYLQNKHMKEKHTDLPNEWKLDTMWKVPQQDKTNATDCGREGWLFHLTHGVFILIKSYVFMTILKRFLRINKNI